jgi:hypothetical protein
MLAEVEDPQNLTIFVVIILFKQWIFGAFVIVLMNVP